MDDETYDVDTSYLHAVLIDCDYNKDRFMLMVWEKYPGMTYNNALDAIATRAWRRINYEEE